MSTVVTAEREWPEHKFTCQVITETGAQGLVALQTHSRNHAEEGVKGLEAITNKGNREKTDSVLQCIEPANDEKFSDSGFRAWVASLEE